MKTHRIRDPDVFRRTVMDLLLADAARHDLFLGLLGALVDTPEVYPEHELWLVEEDGEVVAAALRTPPHNLVLAGPRSPEALDVLVDALRADGVRLPGVVGARPEVDAFVERYTRATAVRVTSRMEQAIHVLEAVAPVPRSQGRARRATLADFEGILAWNRAFAEEASPGEPWHEGESRRRLTHRIPDGRGGGVRIWEDVGPVCMVGFVDSTERSVRVGPVYTPPDRRRRGYATALTAEVSRELLARGKALCLLYTDLANPTSNAIYHRIGYRVVCESSMVSFGSTP